MIEDILKFIGIFALLFYFNWLVALICLVFSLLLILFFYISLLKQTKYEEKNISLVQENRQILESYINSHNYFFRLNKKEIWKNLLVKSIVKKQNLTFANNIKFNKIDVLNEIFVLVFSLMPIIVLGFFAYYDLFGLNLELFISLSITIGIWMKTLIDIFRTIPAFKIAKSIINDFSIKNNQKMLGQSTEIFKELVVKNINIDFLDKSSINTIDLKLKHQEKIAILGKSGIGKSTLLEIFMGYEKEFHGQVLWNNKDIKEIDKNVIKNNITYINSENFILPGNLKENINLWNDEKGDYLINEIVSLLKIDNFSLKEDISKMNLSQGEQQRVKLARAFLFNNNVIILDEAFSNIETELASKIRKKLMEHYNIYIEVSHNLKSTELLNFDQVLELK